MPTSTARKTTSRKPAARKTAPKPNPTKPKAQIVENHLHYRTLDGHEIRVPLNIKLGVLERLMALDTESTPDPVEAFRLIGDVIGDDSDKVGLIDVADVINEWALALGRKFGETTLGNSPSSSN